MKTVIITMALLFSPLTLAKNALELDPQITQLQPKKLSSVLVMQNDALLFEQYYNGASADQLHDVRSASKTLTGLMFGKAIEDNYFASEYDKVLPLFKRYTNLNYPSDRKQQMTFFDLLTMTNPLECDDMNTLSQGNEERMYLTYDWVAFFLNLPARANPPWQAKIGDNPYGRDFSYCTAGISVTAAAIEQASGMRFSNYTERTLFEPLEIKNSQWLYNEMGITQGGGGLRIKPKDLLKIGQLVLHKGRWKNQQLLPERWIEKSLSAYSNAMPELHATYGITWWQFPYRYQNETIQAFAAAGNGGNYLYVVPSLNLTAVITSKAYNTPYMHQQTQAIFSDVILPALAESNRAIGSATP